MTTKNLQNENDQLRKRFTQLSDLGRRIMSSLNLEEVLQAVIDAACDLTQARYGALGVFDEDGRVTTFVTHGLSAEERERIGKLPTGQGLLGYLHEAQAPMRLADLSKHEQSVGFPVNHPPMGSFLGAPIRLGDTKLWNLYLTEKIDEPEFTVEDEDVLVLFAGQAALAINNATRFEAERVARAEAEASRLQLEVERRRLEILVETSPVGVLVIEGADKKYRSSIERPSVSCRCHARTSRQLTTILTARFGGDPMDKSIPSTTCQSIALC
jgi:GAF domain-containing protein